MKIADSVFERLQNGESPSEIRKSVSSASKFGGGVQRYLSWIRPELEKLQKEAAEQQARLVRAKCGTLMTNKRTQQRRD